MKTKFSLLIHFFILIIFFVKLPSVFAVSCVRPDTGTANISSACVLDGIPKYDANGTEISRTGIINNGDLDVSGADVTVQPNTTIVWPIGKSIHISGGGRIILGEGASLTKAEPITYQFQNLGFTVNAAGDPVKVVNNNLQVCSGTTCSVALPAGNGNLVVEGQLKFADGTTQTTAASGNTSGWTDGGTNVYTTTGTDNVGIGTTGPTAALDVRSAISIGANAATTGFS